LKKKRRSKSSFSIIVISHNNISIDDTDADDNIAINDADADDNITDENPSDSQNSNASSADYRLATETTDEIEPPSNRIIFSPDVHPEQKHHYLTNKYNIDDESNENSGISFIQGFKTQEEIKKKLQILPHLLVNIFFGFFFSKKFFFFLSQIPRLFLLMKQFILLIYAVYEEEENDGTRIWYKHPHKGFLLPHQLKADAEFFNPIQLVLNDTQWSENGDYT
jgi:hypothetical protein